jgi:WD40 repeat protein
MDDWKSRALAFVLLLFYPALALAQDHALNFDSKIGVSQAIDKFGWMSFVAFNSDGTMVASDGPTAPNDIAGGLALWSFPDGRLIKKLPASPSAISNDWKYYAGYDGVWETETGKPLVSLGAGASAIHAFSPDSRYVAESVLGRGLHASRKGVVAPGIRVVELASTKQVIAFGAHSAFALAISPDGTTLASGHWDLVTLWNMFTGERLGVLRGFGRYISGLSFNRDGSLLAAGTDSGVLQLWDVRSLKRIWSLEIGYSYVSDPAFSPDGRLIAIGIYGTGTAWLIDAATGKIVDHQKVSDMGCGSVAFSPDGRYLITPSTGGLIRWPYDTGGTIRVFLVSPP